MRDDALIPNQPHGSWFPAYTYVPGGPWPHPNRSPSARGSSPIDPIEGDSWREPGPYSRGVALFNSGYYWEAHEEWEALWHAHGRTGPIADLLRGLIKLAAAGVKVRERQPRGVVSHATRAAEVFEQAATAGGEILLGLKVRELIGFARGVAAAPPADPAPPGAAVSKVFSFEIHPAP